MTLKSRFLVVGAGFSGAVLARELAEAGWDCLVIDQREHIAGNCYTKRDEETGVLEHMYGPHIFNTSNLAVWDYVQRFCTMGPYVNRVKASTARGIYTLPINLLTINQFFNRRFNPREAEAFVASLGDRSIGEPKNFEEQALKMLGRELYETFFYGYTRKQWGCEPQELPAAILKRLPVRFNYDDNYYNTKYQGIPLEGYTEIVRRILDHPKIEVKLGTAWEPAMKTGFEYIFFTGALDAYFSFRHGRLGYRTVFWQRESHEGDFQGNAVINYTELTEPFTRIHEHKHFAPWETHKRTLVLTEYSKETHPSEIPYYPKRLEKDMTIVAKYRDEVAQEENVSFLGRLATYRYMDMHHVIGEALDFARRFMQWWSDQKTTRPAFAGE